MWYIQHDNTENERSDKMKSLKYSVCSILFSKLAKFTGSWSPDGAAGVHVLATTCKGNFNVKLFNTPRPPSGSTQGFGKLQTWMTRRSVHNMLASLIKVRGWLMVRGCFFRRRLGVIVRLRPP